jgi:hypothetical protein
MMRVKKLRSRLCFSFRFLIWVGVSVMVGWGSTDTLCSGNEDAYLLLNCLLWLVCFLGCVGVLEVLEMVARDWAGESEMVMVFAPHVNLDGGHRFPASYLFMLLHLVSNSKAVANHGS